MILEWVAYDVGFARTLRKLVHDPPLIPEKAIPYLGGFICRFAEYDI
jgi:hypothetical protein